MSRKGTERHLRSGPERFARAMKFLLIAVSIAVFPVAMVLTAVACNVEGVPRVVYAVTVSVLALLWLVLYGFYSMHVSMGTVLGLEKRDKVVHLYTKRKTFSYDAKGGCVGVKVKGNRFVCTFETQDSRDKFVFYRHAPFSKYTDEQFSEDDISSFCPSFEGEDYHKERGNA